ncbi:hypothetical protein BDZ97DRAFT_1761613 [Flammula alnicola]|nr:hypothetical protein BDZ97DRAFT_1761613 [Flammula alnicola]
MHKGDTTMKKAKPAANATAIDVAPPAVALRIGLLKGKPHSQHSKPATAADDGAPIPTYIGVMKAVPLLLITYFKSRCHNEQSAMPATHSCLSTQLPDSFRSWERIIIFISWIGRRSHNGPLVTLFLKNETEVASTIPPSFLSHRSVSLQSRSSSSRSVSSQSPSVSSGIVAGSLTALLNENTGPSTLPVPHKEALLTFLEIDTLLPYLGFPAVSVLCACFSKYKELDRVVETMKKLCNNDQWWKHIDQAGLEYWQPTYVDLVNIFVVKSQFYSVWKKHFKRAQKYHDMIKWLDDDPNALSNKDLWGEEGFSFSFTDLLRWLDRKEA